MSVGPFAVFAQASSGEAGFLREGEYTNGERNLPSPASDGDYPLRSSPLGATVLPMLSKVHTLATH